LKILLKSADQEQLEKFTSLMFSGKAQLYPKIQWMNFEFNIYKVAN